MNFVYPFLIFIVLVIFCFCYDTMWHVLKLRYINRYDVTRIPPISSDQVKGGDILLMRYNENCSSRWISWFSHIALVVESGQNKFFVELNPEFHESQQSYMTVLPLEERIHAYDGLVCVRQLKKDLSPEQQKHLYECAMSYRHLEYNSSLFMRYLGSKMDVFGNLPHIIDPCIPQNCVELVVSILNQSQVLDVRFKRPSQMWVGDLSSKCIKGQDPWNAEKLLKS